MSQIDIQDLFDKSRFPSGWQLISLLLYTPIGLILVLLRLLVFLQLWLLSFILPDCETLQIFLSYCLSFALGITTRIDPEGELRDKQSRIIVANNVSVMDHFALHRALQTYTPNKKLPIPTALNNALGFQEMNTTNKDTLITSIKQFLATSQCNIALQPEFGTTNSRVSLLKFNSWPFRIESSIQPVAIKTWRPEFASVGLTTVAFSWWSDIFWFMFVPCTIFTLKCLKIKRNSDPEALAREVEQDIADTLGIQTSSHTLIDKLEYEKRFILEKRYNRNPSSGAPINAPVMHSIEMQRMARQVSEVLPLVPRNVILRDLLKTRNVDVTIANILDGIVTYTPEPNASTVVPTTSSSRSQIHTVKDSGTVSRSSFQERKAKMIQEARERYIKKHGLTNC